MKPSTQMGISSSWMRVAQLAVIMLAGALVPTVAQTPGTTRIDPSPVNVEQLFRFNGRRTTPEFQERIDSGRTVWFGSSNAFRLNGWPSPAPGRSVFAPLNNSDGFISTSNPWNTSDSAYFPNGITTAGSTNWIYGTTFIGNAPTNGMGHQFNASAGASHAYLAIGGGNVGIGTTTPQQRLSVNYYTSNALPGLSVSDTSAGGSTGVTMNNTDTSGNSAILFNVGDANKGRIKVDNNGLMTLNGSGFGSDLVINSSGNVGIGTMVPSAKFVVSSTNGAGAGTGDLVIQNPTAYTHGNTRTSAISFKTNNGDNLLNYESVSIRAAMTPSDGVTSPQANLQFWTASNTEGLAERLRITETGSVGIGTASPMGKFVVSSTNGAGAGTGDLVIQNPTAFTHGNTRTSSISFKTNNGDNLLNYESASIRAGMTPSNGVTTPQSSLQFWTASNTEGLAERLRITETGYVGVGTASPGERLEVAGTLRASGHNSAPSSGAGVEVSYGGGVGYIQSYDRNGSGADAPLYISGNHIRLNGGGEGNVGIGTSGNPTERLEVNGNIKLIGTGNITLNGTINAKYQDVAEWVPAAEQLEAGTVVVLDSTKANQVRSSSVSYDTRVAGVISERPGLALGERAENKVLVATTGRVKVKVDASKGPIQIGDLLVTSDVPRLAMKSEAVEFGGRKMHMPGTLIGKALEPLAKGKGEILVLLSLQ